MNNSLRLGDNLTLNLNPIKQMDADAYYRYLRTNIFEIQKKYVNGAMGIVGREITKDIIKDLGSNVEALMIVDENDEPYRNKSGLWSSEFRQDYTNYETLPESQERAIISRVALFILEDTKGSIIVSRRSPNKSHPNMLEIAGGHVSVGYRYLEACLKELDEELKYTPDSLTESDRLFKYRSSAPNPKHGTHGRGTIISTYQVKVPSARSLNFDKNEISELITMTPIELLNAIKNRKSDRKFEENHAYMYLEYLKKILPESMNDIFQEQLKLSHTLTPLELFSNQETVIR